MRLKRNIASSPVSRTKTSPFYRPQPATKPKVLRRFTHWLAVVVIAVLIILALYVSPRANVTADSATYHPIADYQAAANTELSTIADRSKISFDTNGLVLALKKQFPEITNVSVALPLFSSQPSVHISISPPAFVLIAGADKFILNNQGVAVSDPLLAQSKNNLMTIQDQSHFSLSSGSRALSTDQLNFISQIVAQCRKAGIVISNIVLPPAAQELDIHPAKVGYYVKFYMGGNALVEAGQYLAARHHFQQANIQPSQYIDVRVAGKIFYK